MSGVPETGVTFFKFGGHNHDGVNSTEINTSNFNFEGTKISGVKAKENIFVEKKMDYGNSGILIKLKKVRVYMKMEKK